MPLPLETTALTPNAVAVPQLIVQSSWGQMQTSFIAHLAQANVDVAGNWTPTGKADQVFITDVANLPEDLADLQPQVNQAFGLILGLIAEINRRRKIV